VQDGHLYVNSAVRSARDGFPAALYIATAKYRISVSKSSDAAGYVETINGQVIPDLEESHPIGG
jgi:cyclic beta-1,2-glucan synthetase